MTDLITSPAAFLVAIVLVVVVVGLALIKRYKIASPSEAFIITGRRGRTDADLSGQKVVTGSGVFVWPIVQSVKIMDLSARRINIPIRSAVSLNGVKLNVDGIAVIKVGGDASSIRSAAQRFLTQQDQIDVFATETLAGALRSVVGKLTVEEIIRDRAAFAGQVAEATESAFTGQGLTVDTFQIQDITDAEGTYLRDLGRPELARIAQAADIAEADARRRSEQARIAAEREILASTQELALQQAAVKAETDAASARAAAAGPLAAAAREQEVLAEREKVAQAQAALTDRELDTSVRKPADADRYRVEQEARAQQTSTIAAAEAERDKRAALAEATRIEGEATAAATLAVGTSEAEAMTLKAEAFSKYSQAAIVEMLVRTLPDVARELSAPMSNISDMTILSTDGVGAIPRGIATNMTQLTAMVKSLTGVDLTQVAQNLAGAGGSTPGVSSTSDPDSATTPTPTVTDPPTRD